MMNALSPLQAPPAQKEVFYERGFFPSVISPDCVGGAGVRFGLSHPMRERRGGGDEEVCFSSFAAFSVAKWPPLTSGGGGKGGDSADENRSERETRFYYYYGATPEEKGNTRTFATPLICLPRAKAENPALFYCCDLGNSSGGKKDAKNGGKVGFLQFMTREWVRQTRIAGKGGRGY